MAITIKEVLKRVESYVKDQDGLDLIRRAYNFSHIAHTGQKRKSGEPFIEHPLHVALILAQLKMDHHTIAAAVLHDTVEDTSTSVESIKDNFGEAISNLVDGVTKISGISFTQKHEAQAESFRKMLFAMGKDIRVIIIKLADRLHNIRTLSHMPEDKQQRIAQETLDIYAPLANRLGISWMKVELEDQSFRYLRPMMYYRLSSKLNTTRKWRESYIKKVIGLIKTELGEYDLEASLSGRHKHYYSMWRKMEKRGLDFDEITDILAFRIIVKTLPQCYEALGVIHSLWKPIPGKFKDYIAIPKVNLYQSLHTTVTGPEGERVEVQIRTEEMHRIAEEGIAAHWVYKEGGGLQKSQEKFHWLRSMIDWEKDLQDSTEFIESVKLDLFEDQVYVFSPKGEVVELPRGATPIDFAYRIHTEIGHHCAGARINGKIVPIRYRLQNGDKIEIIRSDNQKPNKDWLKVAATSKAKAKIRAFLREEERSMGVSIGRDLLDQELKKIKRSYNKLHRDGSLQKVAEQLNFKTEDDMVMSIGFGKLTLPRVLSKLFPSDDLKNSASGNDTIFDKIVDKVSGRGRSAIKVGGIDDILVRLGKCCNPIPGDPIVGFITRGRGVTVHRCECNKVLEISEERRVDVKWAGQAGSRHQARIRVLTRDTPGILANISKIISQFGANIAGANIATTSSKKAMNTFQIELKDTSQLFSILKAIEKLDGVLSVERVRN
jgi:GTP pyrophosphokinase